MPDIIRLSDCREEVKMFAMAMEAKLRENDYKGGWKNSSFAFLKAKCKEELMEINVAIHERATNNSEITRIALLQECADLANFAMMIADNAGCLSLIGDDDAD